MFGDKRMRRPNSASGYSFIELLVVIIIIGIVASVAMRAMTGVNTTARVEETKQKLERIAYAIAGDPNLLSGGVRTNYGYVGDVGGMPPNLDALVTNPGGYGTWKGPYIQDRLTPDGTNTRYKQDGWGKAIAYSGGATIAATGGGSITRTIASSLNDILRNQVAVTVSDFAGLTPGTTYKDSVRALLDIPNGVGGTTTKLKLPSRDGYLTFDSIPVGKHLLRIVYLPNNDTLRRQVNVDPGTVTPVQVQLFRMVW
jgi:prepilin-type N-terminal cleavage/methylation domain-containing protein